MPGYRLTTKVWVGPTQAASAEDKAQAIRAVIRRCSVEFERLRQVNLRHAMLAVTSHLNMLLTAMGAVDPECTAQQLYGRVIAGEPRVWLCIADELMARYAS